MADDEIIHDADELNEMISLRRKRLRLLERQSAIYGISTPPEITIQIEDLTREISGFQRKLKALESGAPATSTPSNVGSGQGGAATTIHVYGSYIAGDVDTGSGNFVGGSKTVGGDEVGGDKTGGDKITVGDISNSSGIAIGQGAQATVIQASAAQAIDTLFETIAEAIRVRPEDPDVEKAEIVESVEDIKREITSSAAPNAKKIGRWLKNLAELARDVFRLTVEGLADPQLNLPADVRNTIAQSRQLLNQS
jgi:hypothetical protein